MLNDLGFLLLVFGICEIAGDILTGAWGKNRSLYTMCSGTAQMLRRQSCLVLPGSFCPFHASIGAAAHVVVPSGEESQSALLAPLWGGTARHTLSDQRALAGLYDDASIMSELPLSASHTSKRDVPQAHVRRVGAENASTVIDHAGQPESFPANLCVDRYCITQR